MTANEILADIEIYEKFDPVKGTVEGKTYVVVPTTTDVDFCRRKNLRDRHTHRRQYSVDSPYYPNFWRRHHRRRHLGNGSRLSSMVRGKKRYFQQ